jgi:response regulator of citrate/malate metabolism
MVEEQRNPILKLPVLVSCAKTSVNHHIRSSLQELGFSAVTGVFSHKEAIGKIATTEFRSVFFDIYKTDMAPVDFISKSKEANPSCNLIVVAEEIEVNDVFDLLRVGATGFIVPPFTFDAVEKSISYAERVAAINPELLDADNVSEAVVEAVLNNFEALHKLMAMKNRGQATYQAQKMIQERMGIFRESADVAKAVLAGEAFLDIVIDRCIDHANKPTTRLGKLRRKLKQDRNDGPNDTNEDQ